MYGCWVVQECFEKIPQYSCAYIFKVIFTLLTVRRKKIRGYARIPLHIEKYRFRQVRSKFSYKRFKSGISAW